MYNHLPKVDPTRSLDGRHRAPRSEAAELRRLHREHVAAARARTSERRPAAPLSERILTGPAAALMALVGIRR